MNCSPLDCQKQALEARIKELASLVEAKDREISRLEQKLLIEAARVAELETEVFVERVENVRLREALVWICNNCSLASDPIAWPKAMEATRQATQSSEDGNRQPLAQVERRSSEAAGTDLPEGGAPSSGIASQPAATVQEPTDPLRYRNLTSAVGMVVTYWERVARGEAGDNRKTLLGYERNLLSACKAALEIRTSATAQAGDK